MERSLLVVREMQWYHTVARSLTILQNSFLARVPVDDYNTGW